MLNLQVHCIVFTRSQTKNQHFRPARATRCTDSREICHDQGAHGSAWSHEISRQSVHGGGNAAPNGKKIQLFDKESPHRGELFDRFLQLLGFLYAHLSCISILHLISEKPRVGQLNYPEFFHAPCRKKNYALDRKTIGVFLMISTSFIMRQSLGKIVLYICRCENVVFFFCHAPMGRAVRSRGA